MPPDNSARALPLTTVADISLSGGGSRFDYQSLDPQANLLFIAHLGASRVHVFDVRANKIVADIPDLAEVHGVLAVPELGRVYASAIGDGQVAAIDERTLTVVARIPAGAYVFFIGRLSNVDHGAPLRPFYSLDRKRASFFLTRT